MDRIIEIAADMDISTLATVISLLTKMRDNLIDPDILALREFITTGNILLLKPLASQTVPAILYEFNHDEAAQFYDLYLNAVAAKQTYHMYWFYSVAIKLGGVKADCDPTWIGTMLGEYVYMVPKRNYAYTTPIKDLFPEVFEDTDE